MTGAGAAFEGLQRGDAPGRSYFVVLVVVLAFDAKEKNMRFRVGQTWV